MEDYKEIETISWKKLKKGNIAALGDIYDLYIDDLYLYGMQRSEDKDYVMDCIHDLFLDLYKYRSKLATTNNVKYYLLKSLKRKLSRQYKSKVIPTSNEYHFESSYTQGNYSKSPEEEVIELEYVEEKTHKLTEALTYLTKRQKKGLSLRFNEEKSYETIAEIMDVSVQTSRTIIYRGIKTLRQHIPLFLFYLGYLY